MACWALSESRSCLCMRAFVHATLARLNSPFGLKSHDLAMLQETDYGQTLSYRLRHGAVGASRSQQRLLIRETVSRLMPSLRLNAATESTSCGSS